MHEILLAHNGLGQIRTNTLKSKVEISIGKHCILYIKIIHNYTKTAVQKLSMDMCRLPTGKL